MTLPIRTTQDDIRSLCKFFASKPTGASLEDAKRVLDGKFLDGRKLAALKRWGLIESDDGKFRVTARGRQIAKDNFIHAPQVLRDVLRSMPPYSAILERAAHNGEDSFTSTEVAAHWHEFFEEEAGDNDVTLNDSAVAFFQLVEGAKLGRLVVGRKGSPTRIQFDLNAVSDFSGVESAEPSEDAVVTLASDSAASPTPVHPTVSPSHAQPTRVFISHGKNRRIVEQLKEIVSYGKFEPIISVERETTSRPVPEKVMEDMRSCFAGIIHVAAESDSDEQVQAGRSRLNENVLIEIGAAMALYGKNIVLLVQDGTKLPSNLQGLYECRYVGDVLDGAATMKLLKMFNEMR